MAKYRNDNLQSTAHPRWAPRARAAKLHRGEFVGGTSTRMRTNEPLFSGDCPAVPKGARNKEGTFRLVNFILNKDRTAVDWMTETTYALCNERAVELMSPHFATKLPARPTVKGKHFFKDLTGAA